MAEDVSSRKTITEDVNNLSRTSSSIDQITSTEKGLYDSDAENEIRFTKSKTKLKYMTENDSDNDGDVFEKVITGTLPDKSHSDENSNDEVRTSKKKTRIRNMSNSDSESDGTRNNVGEPNKYDLSRTKMKNKKLHDKFKKLKHPKSLPIENTVQASREASDGEDTNDSSDESISCSKIKQKVKKKSSHSLTQICDPDTSEDESNVKSKSPKSKPRSTKLISPKPARMSAKQAMENMQKIKSESNRMLREKEVSLPYHRPKALTLKDIINRRKPAVTSDGKALPIKMNNEQLKQYALMLEERQKEMMELCKSDTDDDEEACPEAKDTNHNLDNLDETKAGCVDGESVNGIKFVSADMNDTIYDEMILAHNMSDSKTDNLNDQNVEKVMVVNEERSEEPVIDNDKYKENDDTEKDTEKEAKELTTMILAHNDSHLNILPYDTEKEEQIVVEASVSKHNVDLDKCTEEESQEISLHYDSEMLTTENHKNSDEVAQESNSKIQDNIAEIQDAENHKENLMNESDDFSDNDFTMDELDQIIEKAECNKDKVNKILPNIESTLEIKPMLTGSPGMVINLDDSENNSQKKLTGVELLKERFTYFAKLKSLEDMEKDREKKFKPGTQHLKLRQALEEQIAEQRSLEWEKRLQEENQLKMEMSTVEGEHFDGEDIEKIEAKLEETDLVDEEEESSSEEELEENDICNLKEKPRIRNPLVDDEAEVSDDEDVEDTRENINNEGGSDVDNDNNAVDDDDDDDENDDEDSSESEQEIEQSKCRKGRILKAFEDSDDDDAKVESKLDGLPKSENNETCLSQDDEIQLAQPQKTYSDDLFTSQECSQKSLNTDTPKDINTSADLGSQTFSILTSITEHTSTCDGKDVVPERIDVICDTQPCSEVNFEDIVGMCTAGFSQNLVTPQAESSQLSQSQELGDNVAALCTGKFYDNPFVSQTENQILNDGEHEMAEESFTESAMDKDTEEADIPDASDHINNTDKQKDNLNSEKLEDVNNLDKTGNIEKSDTPKATANANIKIQEENKLLKSIIDELGDPEFDSPKPNKYFFNDTKNQTKSNAQNIDNTQFKKKFVIESDEEANDSAEVISKKKKRKKRKLENRALQFSDDEDEYSEAEEETNGSDMEQDDNRLVEYDSEENEVEMRPKGAKHRSGAQFFEQEAELSSEDEYMGSGDEDEAGLDRMEREAGDEDTFHQGRLQRELGEIHMREVLDQDKREVRLLQELFFEDGDLGDGHRQRKFRWRNIDGEEELGTNAAEYADTQEDEFESEEQWRKQRHEREMFLRKMKENGENEATVSINRNALIKASLASRNESISFTENTSNTSSIEIPQSHELVEKKTENSIPSPKKPFIMCQQNYHNSLLTRGRGALARLAALAAPLAGDGDDAPVLNAASNRGNFVFAALTQRETTAKKRKADTAPDSPKQMKRMKKEINNSTKNSLFDHL